jgi:hypothetical protein
MTKTLPKKKDVLAVLEPAMFAALRDGADDFVVPDEMFDAAWALGLAKQTREHCYWAEDFVFKFRGMRVLSYAMAERRDLKLERRGEAEAKRQAERTAPAPVTQGQGPQAELVS